MCLPILGGGNTLLSASILWHLEDVRADLLVIFCLMSLQVCIKMQYLDVTSVPNPWCHEFGMGSTSKNSPFYPKITFVWLGLGLKHMVSNPKSSSAQLAAGVIDDLVQRTA